MNIGQSFTNLHHPFDYILFVQRPFVLFEYFVQAFPWHKLHYEVIVPTLLKTQHKRRDTWMLEAEQQVYLFIETFNGSFALFFTGAGIDQ